MEVGFALRYLKGNFDGRIKALNFLSEVIGRSVEREAVGAGAKSFVRGKEFRAAAVFVGLRNGEHAPLSAGILSFEAHGDVSRGLAEGDVEDVRAEIEQAQRIGVNGVPFFIFANKLAVSGAQSADVLARAMNEAAREGGRVEVA